MTINKLASLIAKNEGKKSEVSIGNIREILKVIAELEADNADRGEGTDNGKSPLRTLLAYARSITEKRLKHRTKMARQIEKYRKADKSERFLKKLGSAVKKSRKKK